MKKIAIFVEGQTELIFVEKLLREIIGSRNISIDLVEEHSKTYRTIQTGAQLGQPYFALIVNCGSDGRVASAMNDRAASLVAAGYSKVLGLRDLFPNKAGDLAALSSGLNGVFRGQPIPFCIHLAVFEVESWFIQEHFHFPFIDPACNRAAILRTLGFDVEIDSAETLTHPAEFLHLSYQLGGKAYKKTRKHVQRTVSVMDFVNLYMTRRALVPSFDRFVSDIEAFL